MMRQYNSLFIFLVAMLPAYKSAGDLNENFQKFTKCLTRNGFPGNSIVPQSSKNYDNLNYQWNLRLPPSYPLAYLLPLSTHDVQIAVQCGSAHKIPLVPKSGGHSIEAYSFGDSGTVVLDLRNISEVFVDAEKSLATIGAGALAGEINMRLWGQGFGLPMGSCQTVGIGGLTLGGGEGYLTGLYGLTADRVLEFTMVDARGSAHTVNANENPDLFWALRGIGSGYIGIVTGFKFKLFVTTKLKFTVVKLQYLDRSGGVELLTAWQKWLEWTRENEPNVLSSILFSKDFSIQIIHIQDEDMQPNGNENMLGEFRQILPTADSIDITYPTYVEFMEATSEADLVSGRSWREAVQLGHGSLRNEKEVPVYSKSKSFFIDKTFEESAFQELAELVERIPTSLFLDLSSEFGGISNVYPTASAYVHREALYSASLWLMGKTPEEIRIGLGWMREFEKATQFMDNGRTYQNYVDGERKDYLKRYYGSNLNKLVDLKTKWDPENYFQNPQSIPVHDETL